MLTGALSGSHSGLNGGGEGEALNASASYSTYDLTSPTLNSTQLGMNPSFERSSASLHYGRGGGIVMQDFGPDGSALPPPVTDSWRRIDRWAQEAYYELWCQLSYPATEADVHSLETEIGCNLPQDVRESFFVHDGQDRGGKPTGVFFGVALLDIEEVQEEHEVWTTVAQRYKPIPSQPKQALELLQRQASIPRDAIQLLYSHPGWIPLAKDYMGNNIGVDLAPGPAGTWGQVILFGRDYDTKYVVARSWGAFLAAFADDLEGGSWTIDEESGDLLINEGDSSDGMTYLSMLKRRLDRRENLRASSEKVSDVMGGNGPRADHTLQKKNSAIVREKAVTGPSGEKEEASKQKEEAISSSAKATEAETVDATGSGEATEETLIKDLAAPTEPEVPSAEGEDVPQSSSPVLVEVDKDGPGADEKEKEERGNEEEKEREEDTEKEEKDA